MPPVIALMAWSVALITFSCAEFVPAG